MSFHILIACAAMRLVVDAMRCHWHDVLRLAYHPGCRSTSLPRAQVPGIEKFLDSL